jgi:hypothetical protein
VGTPARRTAAHRRSQNLLENRLPPELVTGDRIPRNSSSSAPGARGRPRVPRSSAALGTEHPSPGSSSALSPATLAQSRASSCARHQMTTVAHHPGRSTVLVAATAPSRRWNGPRGAWRVTCRAAELSTSGPGRSWAVTRLAMRGPPVSLVVPVRSVPKGALGTIRSSRLFRTRAHPIDESSP